MSARLTVAVPEAVTRLRPGSGHGAVWANVLRELDRRVKLRVGDGGRRADVWLADGHAGALDVPGPVVVQVHEVGWHRPELRAVLDPAFADALERATAAGVGAAARVIVPSRAARASVIEALGVDEDRVHPVAHGVDSARFRPRDASRSRDPYVLFVSQLHPRKNLDALREAMALLHERGLTHDLVIVGEGAADRPDSSELVARATAPLRDGTTVRHVARPSDAELAELMAAAAAFCLPSLFEGFGLTALEAMACGAPVVVSDRGALPEVVGDAGLVVDPAPEALADALERVLRDDELADRLSALARARAEGFTWAATAAGWEEVLRRAV